ncbi:MAG: hypothetical protein ABJN69_08335 [Hellea sp.]
MGKRSKPWLNYRSGAPEREYPQTPKKKRSFRCALFWLFFGGHCGVHRLYLWEPKKAGKIFVLFIGMNFLSLMLLLLLFGDALSGSELAESIAFLLPYLIIVVFEATKLRGHVNAANKKFLLR